MGYDLDGKGGWFRWQEFDWPNVLQLAIDHGWKPQGTVLYSGKGKRKVASWCRAYDSNDGQTVVDADACLMGEAIEKALAVYAVRPRKKELAKFVRGLGGVEYLGKFATFCRAGAFHIC